MKQSITREIRGKRLFYSNTYPLSTLKPPIFFLICHLKLHFIQTCRGQNKIKYGRHDVHVLTVPASNAKNN